MGNDYAPESPEWRVMMVILDGLRQAQQTPLRLPMASDGRLLRVMEALLKNPGDPRGLTAWAASPGPAHGRCRGCSCATGLTFGAWRKRLLLQEGIERLSQGDSVTRSPSTWDTRA